MTPNFTSQELCELKLRFNDIKINEALQNDSIVHTLSSGRIIYGYVNENQVLQVKSVQDYLCG